MSGVAGLIATAERLSKEIWALIVTQLLTKPLEPFRRRAAIDGAGHQNQYSTLGLCHN
jgi:hypothetical protein